ncbi:hypothetical protein ACPA9J_00340 [Pseudomonas aeruginosa]
MTGAPRQLKGLDPEQGPELRPARGGRRADRPAACSPSANLEKPEVRAIAEKHGLHTAKKKDSTASALASEHHRFPQAVPAGPSRATSRPPKARVIPVATAAPDGHPHHPGQRQSLGIGGFKAAGDDPWCRARQGPRTQRAAGRPGQRPPAAVLPRAPAASRIYRVNPVNWSGRARLRAKVRATGRATRTASWRKIAGRATARSVDEPQRAVTLGNRWCSTTATPASAAA